MDREIMDLKNASSDRSALLPVLRTVAIVTAALLAVGVVPEFETAAEADIPDVHSHAGAIQAGIPGAKRMVIPDAGHLVYLERPKAFNEEVQRFLRGDG